MTADLDLGLDAKALLDAGKKVSYGEIESRHGHDAFLMEDPPYHALMRAYMNRIAEEIAR